MKHTIRMLGIGVLSVAAVLSLGVAWLWSGLPVGPAAAPSRAGASSAAASEAMSAPSAASEAASGSAAASGASSAAQPADETITGLNCTVTGGRVTILEGTAFGAQDSAGNPVPVTTENGVYTVTCGAAPDCDITVTVPQGHIFSDVTFSVTGGTVDARQLTTDTLHTHCDGGAVLFSGTVRGDADIEHLRGDTSLQLTGAQTDYNYALTYSMGHVGIGTLQYGGLQGSQSIDNGAAKTLRVQCTMGNVSVGFTA